MKAITLRLFGFTIASITIETDDPAAAEPWRGDVTTTQVGFWLPEDPPIPSMGYGE